MPLTGQAKKDYHRAYMRKRRAAQKAAKLAAQPKPRKRRIAQKDPARALVRWAEKNLIVPPGHPKAGQRMKIPGYGIRFLRDALTHKESFLCIGRKNAKSAIVAVFLLGRLVGPIQIPGYRGGVCSVSKEKAGELKAQMQAIAEASDLEGLTFYRSPVPGYVTGPDGRVDILSADKSAGHASGFDDAIVDELGLLSEKDRELINGMRSSVSAKDGRFIALSIQGDAPFTQEIIDRKDDPGVAVHHYAAPEVCSLDDRKAWHSANPGIRAGIKSLDYMIAESNRVLATPADQPAFRAYDLNQPQSPSRVMLCDTGDWLQCETDDLPERGGPCIVGFDLGGSSSMTAAVALWPETKRVEVWAAFPNTPNLKDRAESDGCRGLYQRMEQAGELKLYPGRVLDVSAFLGDVAVSLAGERIIMAGADRFRRAEAVQALEKAKVNWPMIWRGTGAHAKADGSHDVRATQRRILSRRLAVALSLVMRSAIANSMLRFDPAGNPALLKWKEKGRIDALSALVIACGLAEIWEGKPKRKRRHALA